MRRLTSGTLTLLVLSALSACSDSEEPAANTAQPSGASTSQMAALQPGQCSIDAEISGDAQGEFDDKGEYNGSINESQPSIYRFFPGKEQVVVYAAAGGIEDAVTFSLDGSTYSTSRGEFDIDPDGSGATFDATAQSSDGKTVEIVGEVVCKADDASGASEDDKSGKKRR